MIEEPDFTIPQGMTLEEWLLLHVAEGDTDISVEKKLCEHQYIHDCDTGLSSGRMYCLKCDSEIHDPNHDCKYWGCGLNEMRL